LCGAGRRARCESFTLGRERSSGLSKAKRVTWIDESPGLAQGGSMRRGARRCLALRPRGLAMSWMGASTLQSCRPNMGMVVFMQILLPVRGLMWCPVVAPRKPPQAPCSSQEATPAAAAEPGPSTPSPAIRSERTKAEQAVEAKGKAAKAKPAPQPGKWLDRDCNAALNMQRIGESRAGEAASQGQGVPWPGLQAATRQATQGPAAACLRHSSVCPLLELSSAHNHVVHANSTQ
ncbi:hypothetical protein HaLaN_07409, partial [Haematococcus lacustris]